MNEIIPLITVTCLRDLPLLDLQAQSIHRYLDIECPVYLIVNEESPDEWNDYFNQHLRQYYKKHQLTILYRNDFAGEWTQWVPHAINPWAVGWETQQVLKLAIATKITAKGYFILDSQNFLIDNWSTALYEVPGDKIPYRFGHFVMPMEIWDQYSSALSIDVEPPTKDTMSICTPMFMSTALVNSLIEVNGGLLEFSKWFKNASRIKSEFILYLLWAEKNGGLLKYHFCVPDWSNPYLRDSNQFAADFDYFINFIGVVKTHVWVSANHRSWGDMTDEQYRTLLVKLKDYGLFPNFLEYRANYVDIKI